MSPRGLIGRITVSASDRLDPVIPAALAVVAAALFAVLLFAGTDPAAAAAVAVALLAIATGLAIVGWRAARVRGRRRSPAQGAVR